ncbi:hypothetical protein [Streptomyces sp. NPDC085540]|uniref:hypothetical protein n=1 Tax=Streptomyces sp. NPDC085540 TaxID=3365730 RepID=UPI0037CDB154
MGAAEEGGDRSRQRGVGAAEAGDAPAPGESLLVDVPECHDPQARVLGERLADDLQGVGAGEEAVVLQDQQLKGTSPLGTRAARCQQPAPGSNLLLG